jgi:pyrimidine operon attenuation protein/uracil phosphoribosyltransferase
MTQAGPVQIMNQDDIDRVLSRMAHQIRESDRGDLSDLAIVGIRTRGVPLARRLAEKIARIEGVPPPVGVLDINLYRDDLSRIDYHPVLRKTEIPFDLDDRHVVLVDDVLFTGRTIRAALDALIDLGRPRVIQLAVLVEREGRELPIQADFVGKRVPSLPHERIDVLLMEQDGTDAVQISTTAEET